VSPVLVATSAYGASMVRQLGQTHFIGVVASAGAAGIEIRRELFTSDQPDLVRMGNKVAEHGLFSVYSAPIEMWRVDGSVQQDALQEVMVEAAQLGARYLKVSLGHFPAQFDLTTLASLLAGSTVALLIENDQTSHGGNPAALARFLSAAAAAGIPLGMTFDMGNWHWAGADPEAAAVLLSPYVRYVHCKAVSNKTGTLAAVPLSDADPGWRAMFSCFPQGVPRAIEFPIIGSDLVAVTRQYVDLLATA
jgi:sugar phosphate isomerase/epimerase